MYMEPPSVSPSSPSPERALGLGWQVNGGHFGLWLTEPLGRQAKGLGALRGSDGVPQGVMSDDP